MKQLLFMCALLVSISAFGADDSPVISFKVSDNESKKSIEYCVVCYNKKGIMGNENGIIQIKRDNLSDNDTLWFSSISHKPRPYFAKSFLSKDTAEFDILLEHKDIQLREIVVPPPKKIKTKTTGKHHKIGMFNLPLIIQRGDKFGYEIISKKKCKWLKSVGFYIYNDQSPFMLKTQKFRVIIYDGEKVKSDVTNKFIPILESITYFDFDPKEISNGKFIKQLDVPFKLPPKAMVSIEFLGIEDFITIPYRHNIFGKSSWCNSLQWNGEYWIKGPIATPFFFEVIEAQS